MKKSLFKSYFSEEMDCCVEKTKFINNRIKIVEKHIPEIGKALFNYTDKKAKSRDCSDKIALVLQEYAKAENVTSGFKFQVSDFANILLDVGTSQDYQIKLMETKVLEKLSDYDKLCKGVQAELKLFLIANEKEKTLMRQVKKLRESHAPVQQQVSLAEAEFLKARGDSTRLSKNLEEQIDIFEKKRLITLKETLLAWTIAELQFHAKALQFFTDAYRIAADIDVNTNVEEFRNKLCSTDDSRPDILHKSESFLQLISLPFQRKAKFTGNGIPHPSSAPSSLHSSRTSTISDTQSFSTN